MIAAEAAQHLSYLQDAWQTTTSPAHITAEVIFTCITDGLIGLVLIPFIRRAVRRHDRQEHKS